MSDVCSIIAVYRIYGLLLTGQKKAPIRNLPSVVPFYKHWPNGFATARMALHTTKVVLDPHLIRPLRYLIPCYLKNARLQPVFEGFLLSVPPPSEPRGDGAKMSPRDTGKGALSTPASPLLP